MSTTNQKKKIVPGLPPAFDNWKAYYKHVIKHGYGLENVMWVEEVYPDIIYRNKLSIIKRRAGG